MIEDKKLGIKFAESKMEAAWFNVAERCKQTIEIHKGSIKKAKEDLKIPPRKIVQRFRKGAKTSIEMDKRNIEIQKEVLKLAESKIIKKVK
jgi:hypothetical protein